MFNAANILEALKNYIYTRGGTSNAYNIAEAVNDLNSIPQGSGGDIPPEVTNAIETHGMGWTESEPKEGFDIQWDGNTEGLENVSDTFFKVDSNLHGITSTEDLIGASIDIEGFGIAVVTAEDIETDDNKVYAFGASSLSYSDPVVIIAFEDGTYFDDVYTKGIWFGVLTEDVYVSRLYKEASTQEVVHQIDQKYIPQGSGGGGMFVTVVFDDNLVGTADKTLSELVTAYESGMNIIATIEAFDMTIAKVTCTQYADGTLRFGLPVRTDDDGFCLVPLQVYDSDGADVWETNMI